MKYNTYLQIDATNGSNKVSITPFTLHTKIKLAEPYEFTASEAEAFGKDILRAVKIARGNG